MNITFDQFLRPFFESGETVNIRVFDDKKTSAFKGAKLESNIDEIEKLTDTLKKHNAQGRGIFFVVNYGGDCDEDINRINAVFVENDKLSIEEQITRLEAFPLPPSLMVKCRRRSWSKRQSRFTPTGWSAMFPCRSSALCSAA